MLEPGKVLAVLGGLVGIQRPLEGWDDQEIRWRIKVNSFSLKPAL